MKYELLRILIVVRIVLLADLPLHHSSQHHCTTAASLPPIRTVLAAAFIAYASPTALDLRPTGMWPLGGGGGGGGGGMALAPHRVLWFPFRNVQGFRGRRFRFRIGFRVTVTPMIAPPPPRNFCGHYD